jgi:hypothetical protein
MIVACTALVLSLAGTGYAALRLPANSVGSKQLKDGAVTNAKVKRRSLTASVFRAGTLLRGPRGIQGPQGVKGDRGDPGPSTTTLPSGETLRGEFILDDSGRDANSVVASSISFGGFRLASLPTLASVGPGGPPTTSCPGSSSNPEAAKGTLCFYIALKGNVVTTAPYTLGPGMTAEDVTTGTDGRTDTFGALLYARVVAAGRAYIEGSWAVTAP